MHTCYNMHMHMHMHMHMLQGMHMRICMCMCMSTLFVHAHAHASTWHTSTHIDLWVFPIISRLTSQVVASALLPSARAARFCGTLHIAIKCVARTRLLVCTACSYVLLVSAQSAFDPGGCRRRARVVAIALDCIKPTIARSSHNPLLCGWPCLATRCMQRSIVLGGAHFGDRGRPFWRCSDGLCVSHV